MTDSRHILDPDTQATLLLTSNLGSKGTEGVSPLNLTEYNRLAQWLLAQEMRPADLLNTKMTDRLRQTGEEVLDTERILKLLDRGGLLALQVESWTNQGLWVLSRSDDTYPKRLKDKLKHRAPPVLYGAGNLTLLQYGGLGMVGSRNTNNSILESTRTVAQRCVRDGIQVISGGARGVDQTAMLGALENNGNVIGVLADSLAKASVSGMYRDYLRAEQLVLVSPYAPHVGFNVGNAMGRNKLIYALSDWTLVMSTEVGKGGTWSGATENLRRGWVPVFVYMGLGAPEGNQHLLEKGTVRLEPQSQVQADLSLRDILDQLQADQVAQETFAVTSSKLAQPSVAREPVERPVAIAMSDSVLTTDPDFFWNEHVWRSIRHLVVKHNVLDRKKLSELLDIKVTQADAWLKRAVDEGKLRKQLRPVRFVLPDTGQLPLLGEG